MKNTNKVTNNSNNTLVFKITKQELQRLTEELSQRQALRVEIADDIADTVEANNDLPENSTYDELIRKQEMNEARISEIKYILHYSEVIKKARNDRNMTMVGSLGSKITLCSYPTNKCVTYLLVTDIESDPLKNKLSITSPIGQTLHGKPEGYKFQYGDKVYVISKIK